MSFILDALKKAEAERHMGQIPGLHAQPVVALPAATAPVRAKKAALGAATVLLVAVAAALAWVRPWHTQVQPPQQKPLEERMTPPAAAAPAPAVPTVVAPSPAPTQRIVAVMPPPETRRKPPVRPPAAAKKPPVTATRPPAAAVAKAAPAISSPAAAATARPPAGQTAQARADKSNDTVPRLNAALVPESGTISLRELPEQIQRELPNLAIGGYIYSDNPRERQLLINKRLLHEGEEAAPGVTLEKMMPKAAIFNYKGYRYRLAY